MRLAAFGAGRWLPLLLAVVATACNREAERLTVVEKLSPVGGESRLSQVTPLAGGVLAATWLEPVPEGGYLFRMATWQDEKWSTAVTIASGTDLVTYPADLPGLVEMAPGRWLAYWQRFDRASAVPGATILQTAQTTDAGHTWTPPVTPHRDGVSGTHGFVAGFPIEGRAGLVWLDARRQTYTVGTGTIRYGSLTGAIGLRYATIDQAGGVHDDQFIDPITCDCCPNASAVTARGPVVAYRDRSTATGLRPEDVGFDTGTVRDIYVTRLENARWTTPVRVHEDNWVINACPDNGPALDAAGDALAVAWWTLGSGTPEVKVAFSTDAGTTFGTPVRVDQAVGLGQVTVALRADGASAVVGWMEGDDTWARVVRRDGRLGPPVALGRSPTRHRLPHWVSVGDDVLAMWTARTGQTLATRFSLLSVAAP